MCLHRLVEQRLAVCRESDQEAASVRGIRLAFDQPSGLQSVEKLSQTTGGEQQRSAQLGWRAGVRDTRATERGQDVELADAKPECGEAALDLAFEISGHTEDSTDYGNGRDVEVRSLARPLVDNSVYVILLHSRTS